MLADDRRCIHDGGGGDDNDGDLLACRYFGFNTDVDAVVYMMLVNNMIHDLYPNAVTIGEHSAAVRRSPQQQHGGNGRQPQHTATIVI